MTLPTDTVWALDGEWSNGYEDLDDWNLSEGGEVDEYRAPVPADALVPAAEVVSLVDEWFEGHDLAWNGERATLPVVEGPEFDALQVALDNYVRAHVDLRRAAWVPTGRTATWTGSDWTIEGSPPSPPPPPPRPRSMWTKDADGPVFVGENGSIYVARRRSGGLLVWVRMDGKDLGGWSGETLESALQYAEMTLRLSKKFENRQADLVRQALADPETDSVSNELNTQEAAPDAVEEKVEQMKIEPWTKAPCATCGETFQVTRTEARDVPDAESLECPECAAYRRGVREAMGGTMNETIEKSRLRSILSMFAMREIGPRLTLVAEVASRTGVGLNLEAARHVAGKAGVKTALEFCADCLPPDELLAMMKERPSEALELAPHLIPDEHLAEIALKSPAMALRHVPLARFDRETLEALVRTAVPQ